MKSTLGLIEGSINGTTSNGVDQWCEANQQFQQNGNGNITVNKLVPH